MCSLIPVLLGVHLGFGALQPGREIPYGQASLLLLAYIGRAEEFCMGCQARYAATALPAYLVGGRMLAGLPHLYAAVVLVIATSLLTVYSALFAAWYFLL